MPVLSIDDFGIDIDFTPFMPDKYVPLLPKLDQFEKSSDIDRILHPGSIGNVPTLKVADLIKAGCEGLDPNWETYDAVYLLVNTGLTFKLRLTTSPNWAVVVSVGGRNTITGAVVKDYLLRVNPWNFYSPLPAQGNVIEILGFGGGKNTFYQFAWLDGSQMAGNVGTGEGANLSIITYFHPVKDLSRFAVRPSRPYAARGLGAESYSESMAMSKGAITGVGVGKGRKSRQPATNKAPLTDFSNEVFTPIGLYGVDLTKFRLWAKQANQPEVTDKQIEAWTEAQTAYVTLCETYLVEEEATEADSFPSIPESTIE